MAGSRPSDKEKGGGHPDPEITGGGGGVGGRRGGSQKKIFRPRLRASVYSKNKGGNSGPQASPLDPPL